MLYYSGLTTRIGDVDDGSTVTDFLPAERARGITIQSAAITFHWPPPPHKTLARQQRLHKSHGSLDQPLSAISHEINLIDTPGHADFTFEVLRSLRVLDGAVCILDGVAGVEAQTETVWAQAGARRIPRIVFVNKLDREGASFRKTVQEVFTKLQVWPIVCHIPWFFGNDRQFRGIGDVVHLRALSWEAGGDGSQIRAMGLGELRSHDAELASEISKARVAMVEFLSERDEELITQFLEYGQDHLAIPSSVLLRSLRHAMQDTFPQSIVPVFAGASFRNIGVQPLLDSIVDLLPTPTQSPDPNIGLRNGSLMTKLSTLLPQRLRPKNSTDPVARKVNADATQQVISLASKNIEACALAFKVVHDSKRGTLVFVRVYYGTLKKNDFVYNTTLGVGERVARLLRMFASDSEDVEAIYTGEIGVIAGSKSTRTGDTLLVCRNLNSKGSKPPSPLDSIQLEPIEVPPPVFYQAIEPTSLTEEKHLKTCLEVLLREDPSLHISMDDESGQTHLSGMGELHLDIACSRLIGDMKASAIVGDIQIGYREALNATASSKRNINHEVAGKSSSVTIHTSIEPIPLCSDRHSFSHPSSLTSGMLRSQRVRLGKCSFASLEEVHRDLPDNNTLTVGPSVSKYDSLQSTDLTLSTSELRVETWLGSQLPEHLSVETVVAALVAGASAALARGPRYHRPMYCTHVKVHLDVQEHLTIGTTTSAITFATRLAVQEALNASNTLVPTSLLEPVMLVNIRLREQDMGSVVHDLSSARGAHILSLDEVGDGEKLSDGDQSPSLSKNILPYNLQRTIQDVYAPPDPFAADIHSGIAQIYDQPKRHIMARVPLKEMVGYLNQLRSISGGRGTFVMKFDGYEPVRGHRLKQFISER